MDREKFEYAGFWRRLLAWIVDSILVILTACFLAIVFGFILILIISMLVKDENLANSIYTLTGYVIGFISYCVYFIGFEVSNFKATPGKLLFNMIVLDEKHEKIGFLRATTRLFAKFLSGFLLGMGFLVCMFTQKKQALHDIIANTLVIKKTKEEDVI